MLYTAIPVRHPARGRSFAWRSRPLTISSSRWRVIPLTRWRSRSASSRRWLSRGRAPPLARRAAASPRRRPLAAGDFARPPGLRPRRDRHGGAVARRIGPGARRRASRTWRDRARMEAILAGMVKGVLVLDAGGRVRLVNKAARRMLRIADAPASAGATSNRPASRHRGADRRALRGENDRGRRAVVDRGAGARVIARAARSRSRPAAARARAARHHRPAASGPDPPRFRRQRLARAAHAADRDARLRRGAADDAPTRRKGAEFLEIICRHTRVWSGWCATCCGWPGSTPGRKHSSRSPCAFGRSSPAWRDRARAVNRRRAGGRRYRIADDAATVRATRPSSTTRCATCSRTRPTTRPKADRSSSAPSAKDASS